MLSDTQLDQLKFDQESYLPDSCIIQTPIRSRTTDGGWTISWANTYSNVDCRLAPMRTLSVSEWERAAALAVASLWVLTIHHDQAIDETYRVVHSSRTYEVEHLDDTHTSRTVKRAYLRRVD